MSAGNTAIDAFHKDTVRTARLSHEVIDVRRLRIRKMIIAHLFMTIWPPQKPI